MRFYVNQCLKRGYNIRNEKDINVYCDKIAQWFTNKSCKQSLLLLGGVGTGKTTMLESIKLFLNDSDYFTWRLVKAIDLPEFMLEREEIFNNEFLKGKWCTYLLIDDVGQEPIEVKSYGNSMLPFVKIITDRYERMLPMIITSNISFEEFAKVYGERTADRLKEMANVMVFKGDENGKSYRK